MPLHIRPKKASMLTKLKTCHMTYATYHAQCIHGTPKLLSSLAHMFGTSRQVYTIPGLQTSLFQCLCYTLPCACAQRQQLSTLQAFQSLSTCLLHTSAWGSLPFLLPLATCQAAFQQTALFTQSLDTVSQTQSILIHIICLDRQL